MSSFTFRYFAKTFWLATSLIFLVCHVGCNAFIAKDSALEASTDPTATPTPTPGPAVRKMQNLGIYYGWLTGFDNVNSTDYANRVSLATTEIAKYDHFVMGAGLEAPSHGDYANTVTIVSNIHAGTTGTKLYGYVCVGTCGGANPNDTTIQTQVDQWKTVGADGIFFDEAGFDYAQPGDTDTVTRTRLVTALSYAHSKSLKAIINAWDPDDIFVKVSTDPLPFVSGDAFLLESYMYAAGTNAIILSDSSSFSNFRTRVNKAKNSKPSGVELWGVSTTDELASAFNSAQWTNLVAMAWADDLTGIGWGTKSYSASDNTMPFRAIPASMAQLYPKSTAVGANGLTATVTDSSAVDASLVSTFSLSP